ncbi:selenium cofactor biosynthesis protein YqeC [Photobacterium swingsii]|uniref:selenium cofactor biosynthesis protein YqeC n=1 Tax=Photobacterium swingsii TaxID=680026 RepID=UPI00352F82E7
MVYKMKTRLIEKNPNEFILSELYRYTLTSKDTPLYITLVGGGGKTSVAFWLAKNFKQWGCSVCVTTTTKMYLPAQDQADYIIPLDTINSKKDDKISSKHHSSAQNDFGICEPTITFIYKSLITDHLKTTKPKVLGLSEKEIKMIENDCPFTVFIIEGDGSRSLPIKAPNRNEPCIPSYSNMVIGVTGAEAINRKAMPCHIHRWPAFSAITKCQPGDVIDVQVLQPLISHPQGLFKSTPKTAKKIWLINKMDLANDAQTVSKIAEKVLASSPQLNAVWLTEMRAETPIKEVILK